MSASSDALADDLPGAVDRLAGEVSGVYAGETVAECVHDSRAGLGVLRVKTHEALLACRFARQRSQLAAALLEQRAGGRVSVRSAGTVPAPSLHRNCTRACSRRWPRWTRMLWTPFPKPLTDDFVAVADVVVTTGCGDACSVMPGRRYVDWDRPDPEGAGQDELRRIRAEVSARVDLLMHELLGA